MKKKPLQKVRKCEGFEWGCAVQILIHAKQEMANL